MSFLKAQLFLAFGLATGVISSPHNKPSDRGVSLDFFKTGEFADALGAVKDMAVTTKYDFSPCHEKRIDEIDKTLTSFKEAYEGGKMIKGGMVDGGKMSGISAALFDEAATIAGAYSTEHPHLNKIIQVLNNGVKLATDVYTTMADVLAFEANPMGAVVGAWAGATLAKDAIDGLREIFPSLDTDVCVKHIEESVFTDIGVATTGGATTGALFGITFGPVGIAIGGALGGAVGSVVGAVKYAVADDKNNVYYCGTGEDDPKDKCPSIFHEQKSRR